MSINDKFIFDLADSYFGVKVDDVLLLVPSYRSPQSSTLQGASTITDRGRRICICTSIAADYMYVPLWP